MARTRRVLRLLAGFLVGSCVSAQVLAMIHYQTGPNGLNLETLPYTPLLALNYLIFMLPTALLVGVPGYLILGSRGWLNGWTVIGIGTLAGVAWALPALGMQSSSYDTALFFGLGGLIASAVFWALVRSNNALVSDACEAALRASSSAPQRGR
jgi:hypothetical protein